MKHPNLIFLIFFIGFSCNSPIENQLSFKEAIFRISDHDLPLILKPIKHNKPNQVKIDSLKEKDVVIYSLINDTIESKVYVIFNKDTIGSSYITIVSHNVYYSLTCCNTKISKYEIKIFKIQGGTIVNVTKSAFPNNSNYNLSKNVVNCYSIYPDVSKSLILLKNRESIVKYIWKNGQYMLNAKNYVDFYKIVDCEPVHPTDSLFEVFSKSFYQGIIENDTVAILNKIHFPLIVHQSVIYEGLDTITKINKNNPALALGYLFNTTYQYYLSNDGYSAHYEKSYFENLLKDSTICKKTPAYSWDYYHIGGAMMNCVFIASCDGYKLKCLNISATTGGD